MSLQVGGARRNSPSVRHIAKCQNPHCGNPNLTRLVDYVKCNVCGWDTRMNAQDVIDRWGPLVEGKANAQESVAVSEAPGGQGDSTAQKEGSVTEDVLAAMDAASSEPSSADLDAVAAEQKAADEAGPRRGRKQQRG
jgi:hypothetical protein